MEVAHFYYILKRFFEGEREREEKKKQSVFKVVLCCVDA